MHELLAKYMIGEATATEKEFVEQWAEQSDYNKKYFADFKLIWETAERIKPVSNISVDESWLELKQLRENKDVQLETLPNAQTVIRPLKGFTQWIKIAAIWISVVGVATLLYTFLQEEPELLTSKSLNEVKTDTLSDGSVITLNKNSIVTYPDKFRGNTRDLTLVTGEAFFSIAHDQSKPFLVHLNGVVVKVVGTSFNIKKTNVKAEVIVETGIVEVIREKVVIRLKPTEKVSFNYSSGSISKGLSKDNFYNYYRTKEFVANRTPLWRVIEVLNEVHGVNIQVPDQALANRTLTTTLKLRSLDSSLDIIADTFKVQVIRRDGHIIIQ